MSRGAAIPRRLAPWIALALLLLVHALVAGLDSQQTVDDAFISFRYARNLAGGQGLAFNPGERIEGYTNFLWVLILAVLMPLADPLPTAKLLGLICNLALIASVAHYSRRHLRGFLGWAPPALLAVSPPLLAHATRGLETSLYTLAVWWTLAAGLEARDRKWGPVVAGLLGGLTALIRPDGLLPAAALAVLVLWGPGREGLRRLLRFGLGLALLLLPYAAWKLAYFGSLVPNTYHAKTGGGLYQIFRGLAYLIRSWSWSWTLLAAVALAGWLMRGRRDPRLYGPLGLVAATVLYVVWVGGDALGPARFLVPALPALAFAAARGADLLLDRALCRSGRVRIVGLMAASGLILALLLPASALGGRLTDPHVFDPAREAEHHHTRLGRCLARHAAEGDSVAIAVIGRVPWYSGLYTLDPFGLIDPHIARLPGGAAGAAGHSKTDPDYILSRRPTFIVTGDQRAIIAAPPQEPEWLRGLRRRLGTDPAPPGAPLPTPPIPGYQRLELDCPDRSLPVWKRLEPSGGP